MQFGYGLNYLIDVDHAIIVDVEAAPARTYDEVASTKTMIERTEQRLDLKPDWLTADTAYGTGKLLAWLLGKSITPHIPVWERYPSSDGMFFRSEFTYDAERDVYVCPNGKLLRTSGTVLPRSKANYATSFFDGIGQKPKAPFGHQDVWSCHVTRHPVNGSLLDLSGGFWQRCAHSFKVAFDQRA